MKTIEHPLMGLLYWQGASTTCDWSGTIVLPSFIDCYEKWRVDGTAFFRDRRSAEHQRGEFPFLALCGKPRAWFGPTKDVDEFHDPPEAQCRAFSTLVERHAAIALNLQAALNTYVRKCGIDFFLGSEQEFERLLQPDRIAGTFELQNICIMYHVRDGSALVGMTFHSEIWEAEHGLGAVVHRDQVIHFGVAEEAWPDAIMSDPLDEE